MPKIKVNDISMYYEISGQGEPVILIGGFGADHTTWLPVAPIFAKSYQVISFDNRGIGQTDVSPGPYSIEQMADDVAELCNQLDIKSAHFVGNSMGGFITQMLGYRHPQLIKSLTISNSISSAYTVFHYYLDAQLAFLKANTAQEPLLKAICAWLFSMQFLLQPGNLARLIQIGLQNPHPFTITGYEGQYAALKNFDATAWIKQIKAPTLVLSGDQDIIFRHPQVEALANDIPGAKYYCFNECGHLPHIEYAELFVKTITDFIGSI